MPDERARCATGDTIEPSVSVPIAAAQRFAATAARRAGARAGGSAVERVRIAALPAAPAPAARRMRRAEVRPLAEIRLAEDHRAGLAQPLDEKASRGGTRAGQRERARGRLHPVGGPDVVLDQDRDAVQRAAHPSVLALGVQSLGDRERVRVQLDHRAQLLVHLGDARAIGLHHGARRHHSAAHRLLQLRDRLLLHRTTHVANPRNSLGSLRSRSGIRVLVQPRATGSPPRAHQRASGKRRRHEAAAADRLRFVVRHGMRVGKKARAEERGASPLHCQVE